MQPDLSHAESVALRRSAHQDGVLDILCGLCVALWGGLLFTEFGGFGGILFAAIYPLGLAVRRRLTAPRIGHVQLRATARLSRKFLMVGLFTLTLVLGLALWAGMAATQGEAPPPWREQISALGDLVLGLLLAFVATMIGLIWQLRRAHLYAVAVLGAFLLGRLVLPEDERAATAFGLIAGGAAPLITGIVLLVRFLRSHPVSEPPSELFDGAG